MPQGRPLLRAPLAACPKGFPLACSSNCTTGPHETWGECVRAKSLQVADVDAHMRAARRHKALDDYAAVRKAGIQPKTVFPRDVREAVRISDATGTPYRADQ